MLTTASMSGNSKRCGTRASRSFGPISGSVLMIVNTLSMTSRNSSDERNSAMTAVYSALPMWRNWAGDQQCVPAEVVRPRSIDELKAAVENARSAGQRMRVAASGHSFTDIACTDGHMLRLEGMNRLLDVDRGTGLVKVEAGIGLRVLSEQLYAHGLALENMGDIDVQTLAGAIATVTLRCVPAFTIDRLDHPRPLNETLDRLDELADSNDHFEFYTWPHSDVALLRESNRTDGSPKP